MKIKPDEKGEPLAKIAYSTFQTAKVHLLIPKTNLGRFYSIFLLKD